MFSTHPQRLSNSRKLGQTLFVLQSLQPLPRMQVYSNPKSRSQRRVTYLAHVGAQLGMIAQVLSAYRMS